MNEPTIEQISRELGAALAGQRFGKIFPLSRHSFAVDFRLPEFLFISADPAAPRVYFVKRRLRDLEKQSGNPSAFVLGLKKRLSNSVVTGVEKFPGERIVIFRFSAISELGEANDFAIAAQLTGRSANLFLLDKNGAIIDRIRDTFGPGQEIGDRYAPPVREGGKPPRADDIQFPSAPGESLSEALDTFYLDRETEKLFQTRARTAREKLGREITKREKLVRKLEQDLAGHGDAARWKLNGDLILANLADAVRIDGKVLVVDYFDENIPTVEIEIDDNDSLTVAAEKFFRRYTKARNAKEEVTRRINEVKVHLENLRARSSEVERAIEERDDSFLTEFIGAPAEKAVVKIRDRKTDSFNGARRFVSTDGFEILVGKASKDNDFLTFRVAKSLDLWLHAADYPGSHVIIKNPSRRELPNRTLLEAAQLAAFYSNAREQPKVAVHYTQRKFVNKPKGAAPGLVSLSSFKTILVEPKIEEEISTNFILSK